MSLENRAIARAVKGDMFEKWFGADESYHYEKYVRESQSLAVLMLRSTEFLSPDRLHSGSLIGN